MQLVGSFEDQIFQKRARLHQVCHMFHKMYPSLDFLFARFSGLLSLYKLQYNTIHMLFFP